MEHQYQKFVVKEQYRGETIQQPRYWDVCTCRQDGEDTIYETVAENCSESDAILFASAPQLLEALRLMLCMDKNVLSPRRYDCELFARAVISKATAQ